VTRIAILVTVLTVACSAPANRAAPSEREPDTTSSSSGQRPDDTPPSCPPGGRPTRRTDGTEGWRCAPACERDEDCVDRSRCIRSSLDAGICSTPASSE
jgi:hypothetical protein